MMMPFHTWKRSRRWRCAAFLAAATISLGSPAAAAPGARPSVPEQSISGTIAFSRGRVSPPGMTSCCNSFLYTIRPDGSREAEIYNRGYVSGPVWSPDGTKIAFSMPGPDSSDIYVIDGSGNPRPVITTPAYHESAPTWSPDGKRLAYVRWVVKDDVVMPQAEASIWTVKVDGSGLRQITDPSRYQNTPAWSPDGRSIAFVRGDYEEPTFPVNLYIVRPDGKRIRRLTHGNGVLPVLPRWSPDGRSIAFMGKPRRNGQITWVNGWSVYVMPARGGDLRHVAQSVLGGLCWSPDGTRLAFTGGAVTTQVMFHTTQSPADLYDVKLDGSDLRQITFTPHAAERDCDWKA